MDRKELIQRRLHVEDRKEKEKAIVEKLLPFLKDKVVAAYVPIQGEVDVFHPLLQRIRYLPRIDHADELVFEKIDPSTPLKEGHFHVLEPEPNRESEEEEIEVFLVPMVGFSKLYRVGYGKGYYDRYLKDKQALKIGIAFECQQTDYDPGSWDIPMDRIITEERILSCES